MQEFDGILNRNDVLSAVRVDVIDDGSQAGRLSAAGGPSDQHESASLLTDLLKNLGQLQFINRIDVRRNDAKHHGDAATLLEEVATEPAQSRHTVGHVEFGIL